VRIQIYTASRGLRCYCTPLVIYISSHLKRQLQNLAQDSAGIENYNGARAATPRKKSDELAALLLKRETYCLSELQICFASPRRHGGQQTLVARNHGWARVSTCSRVCSPYLCHGGSWDLHKFEIGGVVVG